jgi:hypothetical protein
MEDQLFNEGFCEHDELMTWLLLNPELADFDCNQMPLFNLSSSELSSCDMKRENNKSTNTRFETFQSCGGGKYDSQSSKRKQDSSDLSDSEKKSNIKSGRKRQRDEKDVETKVNELRAENADLQAHLYNVTQRTTEVQKQRSEMERKMQFKLLQIGDKDDSDQSELAKLVKEYTDIYADYGKCRQREVYASHLLTRLPLTNKCRWHFM